MSGGERSLRRMEVIVADVVTESKCPVHHFLNRLSRFAGLPVPWIVKWIGAKPDFRQPDEERLVRCVREHLCPVCGRKLGERCYYIGGPRSAESGYFTDPAMHESCARESMRLCPFLNGTKKSYRGSLPTIELQDASGRPEVMYLMQGWTAFQQFRSPSGRPEHTMISAGKLKIVESF